MKKIRKKFLKENLKNDIGDENQFLDDEKLRSLYLEKERQNEYIFNPRENNAFENQNELEENEEYSINLSKDHTNHFNEEKEKNLFQKFFNFFIAQKLLNILTALLLKLVSTIEIISSNLLGKSRTRYKIMSSLLKLLIKLQMILSLRLMQMLLLINKKLIEFDKKYIGGKSSSREKQSNSLNERNKEKSLEKYRSFEISNREEIERSEFLKKAADKDRRGNIEHEKDQWEKYQNIQISLSNTISNKIESSQSIIMEKDSLKRNEDLVIKYSQQQEYLKFLNKDDSTLRFEGSILSKLIGIAKVVYNTTKEIIKNTLFEYNKFDSRNMSENEYEIKTSYKNNQKNAQDKDDHFQFKGYEGLKGRDVGNQFRDF
jgi:hypothetical protein